MIAKVFILFLSCCLFVSIAKANHGMGNGGDAVVCFADIAQNNIQSVELFDYWEQKIAQNKGEVDLGDESLSVESKILKVTNVLRNRDPNLAKIVEDYALKIATNINSYLVTAAQIPEIVDSNPLAVPSQPNCFIKQFAIQYSEPNTYEKRFYISRSLYESPMTTNSTRAGLILHEAIYRYAINKFSATNSDGVRKINYFIATNYFAQLPIESINEYTSLIQQSGLMPEYCKPFESIIGSNEYAGENHFFIRSCFNQYYYLQGVKIYFPTGNRLSIDGKPNSISEISILELNQKFEIVFNWNQKDYHLAVTGFHINYLRSEISISEMQAIGQSSIMSMDGPYNQNYDCSSFVYKFKTNQGTQCTLASSNYDFKGFYRISSQLWAIYEGKPNLSFLVYGSVTGLAVVPESRSYVITTDGKLVNATVQSSQLPTLNLNGFQYQMTSFDIPYPQSILNFSVPATVIDNPYFQGLKVVDFFSTTPRLEINPVCGAIGYKEAQYIDLDSYDVGPNGESFFNVFDGKIVYKVDETIGVAKSIRCKEMYLKTTDY